MTVAFDDVVESINTAVGRVEADGGPRRCWLLS